MLFRLANMLRIVLLVCASPLAAQTSVILKVLDEAGGPIAEAVTWYAGGCAKCVTAADGSVVMNAGSRWLAIRKPGYETARLQLSGAAMQSVVLKAQVPRVIPKCSPSAKITPDFARWGAILRFPRIPSVKVSRLSTDADYAMRGYYVRIAGGYAGIRHGTGAMWTHGVPNDNDFQQSIEYREAVLTTATRVLVDARGRLASGEVWRYVGMIGESASYNTKDRQAAALLDKVLDGVCAQ
ncbi:MAG: hypothetical protein HY820_40940 [Acidobacteria bacterium]|nr:hypothetical protein [Acidobacteriota bacterium]